MPRSYAYDEPARIHTELERKTAETHDTLIVCLFVYFSAIVWLCVDVDVGASDERQI